MSSGLSKPENNVEEIVVENALRARSYAQTAASSNQSSFPHNRKFILIIHCLV